MGITDSYHANQSWSFIFSPAIQVRLSQARGMAQKMGGDLYDQRATFSFFPGNEVRKMVDLGMRNENGSSEPCFVRGG